MGLLLARRSHDLRAFFSLKVKGASVRPCLKNIGRIRHALQFRPLFSEPRANFVVTPI